MTLYLDTSVIVPLFVAEPGSKRAEGLLLSNSWTLAVSDYSEVEFASAIARRVRTGDLRAGIARTVLAQFDTWMARSSERVAIEHADLTAAAMFIRRMDLPLKPADAIHLAAAQRIHATVATFDRQMAESAARLGIRTIP